MLPVIPATPFPYNTEREQKSNSDDGSDANKTKNLDIFMQLSNVQSPAEWNSLLHRIAKDR
jgi:hypothetical protein